MVLQSEMFSGGYKQQSCPQEGYYYSGYGHGPSMHMGPTPSFNSSHMMYSGKHGPQHHTTPDVYSSNGSNMHMPSAVGSNLSHGMPTNGYGSSHLGVNGKFSHGMESGGYGSSYHGSSNHEMPTGNYYGSSYHGKPTGSYGNSNYHGEKHSPMGTKVEGMKHEYGNYKYGHSNMIHNPVHGGYQSAEWNAKSIEDDD